MNREQKCCFGCPPRIGTSALLWTTMVRSYLIISFKNLNIPIGRTKRKKLARKFIIIVELSVIVGIPDGSTFRKH